MFVVPRIRWWFGLLLHDEITRFVILFILLQLPRGWRRWFPRWWRELFRIHGLTLLLLELVKVKSLQPLHLFFPPSFKICVILLVAEAPEHLSLGLRRVGRW